MKKETMKIRRCYFCDTPFEVFTCMHMEFHEKTNSDIYILNRFQDSYGLSQRLASLELFRKVIWIDEKKLYRSGDEYRGKIERYFGTFLTYFRVNKIINSFLDTSVIYQEMFFTCNILCFRLARFYFIKEKMRTKYYMFDEGVGSYRGEFEHTNIYNTIIKRIMFGEEAAKMIFEKYLYRPELDYNYDKTQRLIHKIREFDDIDAMHYSDYLMAFGSNKDEEDTPQCIFFDSMRDVLFQSELAKKKMQEWYELIERSMGSENMIVKLHPRQNKTYKYKSRVYKRSYIPAELEYMNMDLDNMVFITMASTAVLTPKIIFDKEPVVLLLCMVNEKVYKPTTEQIIFLKKVKKIYRDKTKFYMPESFEELETNLQEINEKRKKSC